MATEPGGEDEAVLTPDAAFSVLGNETRVRILQELGEAGEPLSFSDLYDRVDLRDSGNFTYHLDKLLGHFVRRTDDGYELRQAGRRVVEAILSGAVTEAPVVEPTEIGKPCAYCGTPIVMTYEEEQVKKYCTNCAGTYGVERLAVGSDEPAEYGYLGSVQLPPAGLAGRSPVGVLETAYTWSMLEHFAWAEGICPRCAGGVDSSLRVCEDHEIVEGACDTCEERYAANVHYRCRTCLSEHGGMFANHLLTEPALLSFLLEHDVNPLSPPPRRFSKSVWVYEEDVVATDPFRASFTFTIEDDSLTLTVDDDLEVVAVSTAGSGR